MGLLKGTLTFSRYRVTEELPGDFNSFFNRQIRKHAFQDLSLASEELSMGWTSIEDNLDTRFEYANYALADYMMFTLRIDRKTVPAALLRIRAHQAQKAFLAEKKLERLYKEQRKQIVESVRLDLLGKALPVPSFYDVCWCPSKKWLIFGSHAEKVNEDFAKLFERSFKLKVRAFTPWDADFMDGDLAKAVAGDEEGGAKPGRDFLTWLWFKSEERNGSIALEEEDVEVLFVRRILLESGDGDYTETVSCQGLHSDMKEGKAALREGKKIKEASIRLGRDNSECEFTFKADAFQIQSLKMPQTVIEAEDADPDARTLERIYHVEKVTDTMDRLFYSFLKKRASGEWGKEAAKMKRWLEERA